MKIQTSVRVDEAFYRDAKKVFDAFGMTFGDAVNLFLAKVAMEKKIPFELTLPSEELLKKAETTDNQTNTSAPSNEDKEFKEFISLAFNP